MSRTSWIRGGLTLAVVAAVAGALAAAPVGAARKGVTKAKARKIARNVFNKNIGGAPFLPAGSVLVQAQDDPTAGYVEDATAATTLNTVSITAPTAGFFIISGQVDIDNDDGEANFATLDVTIDGADATPNGRAAASELDEDANVMDEVTLGYTITRAVTAGGHTVTQVAQCCTNFDYDGNELTVQFVPSGAVARTGPAGGSASSDADGDA
ncbi:MAG: hypothetical protein ACRDH8_10265 [Actinomycetota bacterium]